MQQAGAMGILWSQGALVVAMAAWQGIGWADTAVAETNMANNPAKIAEPIQPVLLQRHIGRNAHDRDGLDLEAPRHACNSAAG